MKKRTLLSAAIATSMILAACGQSGGSTAASSAAPVKDSEAVESGVSEVSLKGKNVTFICPWNAGGSSDAMTRKVAEEFSVLTGANTSVENQGGAGGTTATTDFIGAATDGTAICLEAVGVFTLQPFAREVAYSIEDFTPVAGLTTEPIVMVASKNSGVTNMDELKAKDAISYGFNGAGSLMELCQKQFFGMANLNATGVSYDGSSETIAAALGGHIDVAVAHPADVLQYIESGDLYPIGIFSAERDSRENLKEIPTFIEQGYDVDMSVWKFMIVPKGTSPEITAYITDVLDQVVTSEDFAEFCDSYTLLPTQQTAEEIVTRIHNEAEVNKKLLAE